MVNWELNPILVREVRARWRRWPAFAVVFGFATLLAVAVWWRYAEFTVANYSTGFDYARGAELGHELFIVLATTQVLCWLLLAPLLTATGLLSERDLGLLQGVQLSELSSREIINGKVLSILAFAGLMLLAPMPIMAVCFLLGGVSPFEIVEATLVTFMAALTAGLIGLKYAARSSGVGAVLARAVGEIVFWAVAPGMLMACQLGVGQPGQAPNFFLWIGLLIYGLLALFTWQAAIKDLARPLWQQCGSTPVPHVHHEPMCVTPLRYEDHYSPPEPIVAEAQTPRHRQLPFVARLRFHNPILDFEIRRRLQTRWIALWNAMTDGATLALGAVFLIYLGPLLVSLYINDNLLIYYGLTWVGLAVMLLAVAVWGAETFAREREQHTWDALLLTPLSRLEIIAGKLKAVLFTCLYYSVPLVMGLLCCVRRVAFYHFPDDTLSLPEIGGALAIAASAVWCYSALAMLVSWLCKRCWVATAWTLAAPVIFVCLSGFSFGLVNPWAAFDHLRYAATLHELALQVAWFAGTDLLLGCGCLAVLYGLMGRTAGLRRGGP